MGRKNNCKHPDRSNSRYRQRLLKRGQTAVTVRMDDLETLRKRQRKQGDDRQATLDQLWPADDDYALTR